MTNPVTGEPVGAPYKVPRSVPAVLEHLVTIPMLLAILYTVAGWVSASHFFPDASPWQRLLQQVSSPATGLPLLIAQLGQMWHSSNVRSQLRPVPTTEEVTK